MNENEVNASYNDDWDDITLTDDDLEEGAEPAEEEEAPEAEDTADQPEAEAEETAAEPEQKETDQSFELKHLDEVRTVNRDEVIQLAQKGMAIVMISSEMPELLGMSDRIYVMCDGRVTGELSRTEATQEKILELSMLKHSGAASG